MGNIQRIYPAADQSARDTTSASNRDELIGELCARCLAHTTLRSTTARRPRPRGNVSHPFPGFASEVDRFCPFGIEWLVANRSAISQVHACLPDLISSYDCMLSERATSTYSLWLAWNYYGWVLAWEHSEYRPALLLTYDYRSEDFSGDPWVSTDLIELHLLDPAELTARTEELYAGLISGRGQGVSGSTEDLGGSRAVDLVLMGDDWHLSAKGGLGHIEAYATGVPVRWEGGVRLGSIPYTSLASPPWS